MLIAINRDFILESRYKSKKINIVLYTIDALNLTSLSEGIYSIDHSIQVILSIHTQTVSIILKLQVEFVLLFIRTLNTKRGIDIAFILDSILLLFFFFDMTTE